MLCAYAGLYQRLTDRLDTYSQTTPSPSPSRYQEYSVSLPFLYGAVPAAFAALQVDMA